MPQDVALISGMFLEKLIADHGPVDLSGGGWECQSVSRAGRHEGIYDPRFAYFYDLLRITNWLQDEQPQGLVYVFENTHPGERQAPNVQKASEMVQSALGAPVITDAAGMGAATHRLRLFWTNMCASESLQEAVPKNLPPTPSLPTLLHHYHVPLPVGHNYCFPFARCS